MKPHSTVVAMSASTVLLCALGFLASYHAFPAFAPMMSGPRRLMPATAVLLCLAAAALLTTNSPVRWPSIVLAALTCAASAAVLTGYGCGDTAFTRAMHRTAFETGLPSPHAMLAVLCIGTGVVLVSTRRRTASRVGHGLALGSIAIGAFVLIAYIFGAKSLYSISPDIGMAPITAVAVVLLSVGVLSVGPRFSLVRVFYLPSEGGRLARRFLPFVFGTPFLLAAAMSYGLDAGWYPLRAGMAVLIVCVMGVLGAMTWRYALNVSVAESRLESLVQSRTRRLTDTIADLEEFSQALAHDVRGPLINLREFLELVMTDHGGELSTDAQDHLSRAMRAARRIDRLTLAMLRYGELSRRSFRFEPVDLDPIARAVEDELRHAGHTSATILVQSPLATAWGDAQALRGVMHELLENACRFARQGECAQITISTEADATTVRLLVHDQGVGVRAEFQERIFHPFEQLVRTENHPGIGLALVKRAVIKMNGRVGVFSDGVRGSLFWVELLHPSAAASLDLAAL